MEIKTKEISLLFYNYILDNNITIISLAAECNCSRFHLGEVLKGNRSLSKHLRIKLNELLHTNY